MNNESRSCQNCKSSFSIDASDFKFYEKMAVPPPTFCPECRLIRRLSFRNERYLYKRRCDLCGKEMISIFAPEKKYKVYCQPCWWSDRWNPLQYAREYDFSRPFFEQFNDLLHDAPLVTLTNDYTTLINSDYVNQASHSKNCYLTSHADHNEDCFYASGLKFSKDCVDITMVQRSEFCHDSLNIMKGYKNFYSIDCESSHNVYFSKNLVGSNDCIGCVNLRHKSYHIFNKSYTKEEYVRRIKEFDFSSYRNVSEFKEKVHTFWKQFPSKYYHGFHNQHFSGDYIYQSKDTLYSYEMIGTEDCRYSQFLSTKPSKDCYDYSEWGDGASLIYEAILSGIGISNIKFGWTIYTNCQNVEYCLQISNCQNIFGSIALRNKKYCILNKQYSKESFDKLKTRIIGQMNTMPYTIKLKSQIPSTKSQINSKFKIPSLETKEIIYRYGEFFPPQLSPFGYNETALEFFALSKEEAMEKGYNWYEPKKREWVKSTYEIPDDIKEVRDDILDAILTCVFCKKNYRVIKAELKFYRRFEIPIPRKCHDCRHFERVKWRSPMRLSLRQCGKCGKQVETNITEEISPIVYCENCYLEEVI